MQLSQTWLLIQSEAGYSLQNALDAYPLKTFNSASASAEKLCKSRNNCIEVSTVAIISAKNPKKKIFPNFSLYK